ncbi:MAG: endonuclease III domain-containing protein, partial [Phycisphaerales bacterium]
GLRAQDRGHQQLVRRVPVEPALGIRVGAVEGDQEPRDMDALLALRGVARKTANVVLGNCFGIQAGVVVDTHVGRLAKRMGLSRHDDPQKVERDLMALFPRERWCDLSHLLIFHGRAACRARGARCAGDPICREFCADGRRAVTRSRRDP